MEIKRNARPLKTIVDGKTVWLVIVKLWADVATIEVQKVGDKLRIGADRPEVTVCALVSSRTRCSIDTASIRKREWELK